MSNHFILTFLRGTIFAPTVKYDNDVVKKMMAEFDGFLPSENKPNRIQTPDGFIEMEPNSWKLYDDSKNLSINFFENKIDVIHEKLGADLSKEKLQQECGIVADMVKRIVDCLNLNCSRLAISPTLVADTINEDKRRKLLNKVFNEHLKFREASVDNCDFSNVFRVPTKINDRNILVNYLTKLSTIQIPEFSERGMRMKDAIHIILDINTMPGKNYSFNESDTADFFDRSSEFIIDILNFYFKEEANA